MAARHYVVENPTIPDSKVCKHCSIDKPIAQFHRWNRSTDGHADWCKGCKAQHQAENRPAEKARFSKWYAKPENKERIRKQSKQWIVDHRDRHRDYQRTYQNGRRQKMLTSTDALLTTDEWQEILLTFNYACAYCLRQDVPLEQEHMMSIAQGGVHTATNVIPACRSCNASKNDRSLLEFVAFQANQPLYADAA